VCQAGQFVDGSGDGAGGVRAGGEEGWPGRGGLVHLHVPRNQDFLNGFAEFHELGGSGGGERFQLVAASPVAGIVVWPT